VVVKLINVDGMAFIGPGSEWFWTAVSGIVLAVTFYAIYRQLRLQRSQAAIDQLNAIEKEYDSERMLRHQLDVLLAVQAGVDPAHLPTGSAAAIANYFDKLGQLVHEGHVDAGLVGGLVVKTQVWWATLEPWMRHNETASGVRTDEGDFRWLAVKLGELSRRDGDTQEVDETYLRSSRPYLITRTQDQIRVEQSLRTVIISSPDAPLQ
jgi:hypothetical protein